ncbi:MAG: methyltransferase domain-containing protein [Dehalococcoidales bacterium]|nr:methyltransferase domain-containing protein [Dehalococcoidales bacterium]MDP6825249.1 methyltransferase domain-containing protein [Dehalococcoidales bacterium]|tara:strand:+ start:705 stop:1373 length:669 start_codon:yes stop_codon:yes gene_type:complete
MTGSMADSNSLFDDVASEYDAWFEGEGKLIFDIEASALRRVLPRLLRPWLEVGVGSGRFAQALGIEIGIDPSTRLLEMARGRGITVFPVRGEESFFDEDTFGTVFLIVTLCFVDSPLRVLKEAHRILKTEGKVVLGLVLRESPWGQFYRAKKEAGHRLYRHATFYRYLEVDKYLKHAGFAVEKIVTTLFQKPGEVTEIETPQECSSPEAGFTVIVASKITGR